MIEPQTEIFQDMFDTIINFTPRNVYLKTGNFFWDYTNRRMVSFYEKWG